MIALTRSMTQTLFHTSWSALKSPKVDDTRLFVLSINIQVAGDPDHEHPENSR